MKKYFLTACAFSILIPNQVFAANLDLFATGSLRNALTEVNPSFTQETGIKVNTAFSLSEIRKQTIEIELAVMIAGGFSNPCPVPGYPGGCWVG